jgi:hypothetical protein
VPVAGFASRAECARLMLKVRQEELMPCGQHPPPGCTPILGYLRFVFCLGLLGSPPTYATDLSTQGWAAEAVYVLGNET